MGRKIVRRQPDEWDAKPSLREITTEVRVFFQMVKAEATTGPTKDLLTYFSADDKEAKALWRKLMESHKSLVASIHQPYEQNEKWAKLLAKMLRNQPHTEKVTFYL